MTFDELEEAAIKFQGAITAFGSTVDLESVDLDGWSDDINDVLFEIDQELSDQEEDEDE